MPEDRPAPNKSRAVRDVRHPAAPTPPLFGVVAFASLVVVCAGLKLVHTIVAPIFLVITLVITVSPLRRWLVGRKVPSWLASAISVVAIYALLIGILGSVVWSLVRLVQTLPEYSSAFSKLLNYGIDTLGRYGVEQAQLREYASNINLSSFTGIAQRLLSGITGGASLLALMVAMVLFLAVEAAGIDQRIGLIGQSRPNVADALLDFAGRVRNYWVVTTIFGLIVAAMDVVALFIIGVPLALTWGVLAFVTNYIPNVGFVLGLVPPALIALLNGGVGDLLAVIVAYAAINIVVQTMIQPRFTGDAVGITGTIAFVSLIFWAFLLGALGALLAVPATLLVKALLVDHSESNKWFGALIDSAPKPLRRISRAPR